MKPNFYVFLIPALLWIFFFNSCTGRLNWDSDVGYKDGDGPGYWTIPIFVSDAQTDYNKGYRIAEAIAFFAECGTSATVAGERKPDNVDWKKGYVAGLKAGKKQAFNCKQRTEDLLKHP